nr:D-glycero-beta-D-manno-heptose-7-phosphate kinase [uncultured Pedobacter sp.]
MLSKKLLEYNSKIQPNILVIGDLMLDHYIHGSATRLSPEAPVPIVSAKKEFKIIGGAGNVANNIIALGGKVSVGGVVGDDDNGEEIIKILLEKQADTSLIVKDKSRSTTLKTRILADNHQIVRVDREHLHPINTEIETEISDQLANEISKSDIVIISDYNKGLLTPLLTQNIINYAKSVNKKVVVDPKGIDYSKYKNAYLIKPNRKELTETAKIGSLNNEASLKEAATVVFNQTNVENLVVTLSEEGMVIINATEFTTLPIKATEVYDVTGAGDTVIATIAYCLAIGLNLYEACQISNYAAAIVIKHVGSATTSIEEVMNAIKEQND